MIKNMIQQSKSKPEVYDKVVAVSFHYHSMLIQR